jgi:hypothetical protein
MNVARDLPASTLWSLLTLLSGAAVFLFFLLRFAKVHLAAVDIIELERMRSEGILIGEPVSDYRTLSYLIGTVAPAIALPSESWVGAYWTLLRLSRVLPIRNWLDRQTRLLAAYQARRYRTAVLRLQDMHA